MPQYEQNRLSRRSFLKLSGITLAALSTGTHALSIAAQDLSPVQLKWYYPGTVQRDLRLVQDALNALIQPQINATVELATLDWSEFDQRMNLINAAGEPYDLVYTASWINNYINNVQNGNLVALDDLLPASAPGLWASMTPETWNGARVNGQIYGVINQQILVFPYGILVRKDLAEKYDLDLDAINTYADLGTFLAALKENEPDLTAPVYTDDSFYTGALMASDQWDDLFGSSASEPSGLLAIRWDDPNVQLFNTVDTPELREAFEMARQWYMAGYYPTEQLTVAEGRAAFQAGRYGMVVWDTTKPGNELEKRAMLGHDFVQKTLFAPLMKTGGITATLTGISRTSVDPERAMMLLELVNTDPQIYNLIAKGIEGTHWIWADEEQRVIGFPENVTAQTSGYNPQTDWMFGNQFNAYYVDEAQVGVWEETAQLNREARVSQALGFSFITDAVQTEIARVQTVQQEFGAPLAQGFLDVDAGLEEYRSQLEAAGLPAIKEEMQRQLDTWKSGQSA